MMMMTAKSQNNLFTLASDIRTEAKGSADETLVTVESAVAYLGVKPLFSVQFRVSCRVKVLLALCQRPIGWISFTGTFRASWG